MGGFPDETPATRASRLVLVAFIGAALCGCAGSASEDPARTLEASGFYDSDGLQVYYESIGLGRPLILVHGWGVDLDINWRLPGWIDALAQERLVIAIDVRGHGRSDKPLDQDLYSYSLMARDVLNLMDTFGIEQADYMGYSMGAFMGAYLLGHHTERFSSMVLGGVGDETADSIATAQAIADALRTEDPNAIEDDEAREFRRIVDLNPNVDDVSREALALAALQMWPEGFAVELGGSGLADANIPVLVANGDRDLPYVDTADRFADALPMASTLVIPNSDHFTALFAPGFQEATLMFFRSK